jgi:hypothetical protein
MLLFAGRFVQFEEYPVHGSGIIHGLPIGPTCITGLERLYESWKTWKSYGNWKS